MRRLLLPALAALLSLGLVVLGSPTAEGADEPAPKEDAPAEGDADKAEGGEGDEAEDDKEEEDEEPVVGENRPVWLESLDVLTRSVKASLSEGEPDRGKALAMVAQKQAGENERLVAAADFAAALAELARGDAAAFGRHIDKALGPLETDAATAELVVASAKTRASVGDYDGARASLESWGGRMGEAGLDETMKVLNDAAKKIKPPPPPPPPPEATGDAAGKKKKKKKRDDVAYPIIID